MSRKLELNERIINRNCSVNLDKILNVVKVVVGWHLEYKAPLSRNSMTPH